MFVIWYMRKDDDNQASLAVEGLERARFFWDLMHNNEIMLLSTRP